MGCGIRESPGQVVKDLRPGGHFLLCLLLSLNTACNMKRCTSLNAIPRAHFAGRAWLSSLSCFPNGFVTWSLCASRAAAVAAAVAAAWREI